MITQEQIEKLCGDGRYKFDVLAVLTRDYKPTWLSYALLKGTVVRVRLYREHKGDLIINNFRVDGDFPYDAAELLE